VLLHNQHKGVGTLSLGIGWSIDAEYDCSWSVLQVFI